MNPEQFANELNTALGRNLVSVILYGSAASGDYLASRSDYNLLVLTEQLGLAELNALRSAVQAWVKRGNPPPLLFTETNFRNSIDVFPLELLDIQQVHRLLHGRDVLSELKPSSANLRHQLEFELRTKLAKLRSHYLLSGTKERALDQLMISSLASFLALCRGALRLFEETVPADKLEAVRLLSRRLDFPVEPFEIIAGMKAGRPRPAAETAESLFAKYLAALEQISDRVDRQFRPENKLK